MSAPAAPSADMKARIFAFGDGLRARVEFVPLYLASCEASKLDKALTELHFTTP